MSDEGPPPIVPAMQTAEEDSPATDTVRTDGGEATRSPPAERPYGAPLVPDCS